MDNMNYIHNNHHDFSTQTTNKLHVAATTVTFTASDWIVEENFSMAMDDHHHINPITPLLFDQQQVCPNNHNTYLHNNNNINITINKNKNFNIKPSLQIITKENEILEGDEEEKEDDDDQEEELGAMKEMMYRYAVMQPVDIDPSTIRKPKRRNVRISNDPQSVAARHRRERISEKTRILQRLVPGGTKMDTASMLDEAIRYVKFLKKQIKQLQRPISTNQTPPPVPNPASGWGLVGPSIVNSIDQRDGNKGLVIRDHFQIGGMNNFHHHQGN